MNPSQKLTDMLTKMMTQNPVGCAVIPGKDVLQIFFWQRPAPEEAMLWMNAVTGLVNQGIQKGFFSKAAIINAITESVPEATS